MGYRGWLRICAVVPVASMGGAALANGSVTLSGTVLNSCVLSVSAGGAMVVDGTGTAMRSDAGVGARGATMAVSALGSAPTLTFSAAPTLSAPSGFIPDSVQYSYRVNGTGHTRGFDASQATANTNLIDTVTIHGLVTSGSGFPAGNYTQAVQVTCGQ